jgi:hypothetical protein
MERTVSFRDRQELQGADLSNIGAFGRAALDHVVADGISDLNGWVDFTAARSGVAELTIGPGRIYVGGAVYVAEASTVFDLLAELPSINRKWAAIVGFGTTIDTDVQPRDFLINPTTGATEPQAVAMENLRLANINLVAGVAAAQPVKPIVPTANVVIAWVLLAPNDIENVTLEAVNRVPQVLREKLRNDAMEEWRNLIGPRVDSLASDLAKLQALLSQMGDARLVSSLAVDVARLKELGEIDAEASDYDADRFLDTNESATTDVNFLAKVEEGVRFSDAAAQMTDIEVFNPLNPDVVIASSGFMLPKYAEQKRFSVGPFAEAHSISQYQYQTHQFVQKTLSRTRIRYGEDMTVCTNASWWRSGTYDPVRGVFYKDGETWELVSGNPSQNHQLVRLRRFWVDSYTVPYWDRITIDHAIGGQQVSQTFLNPQDGWLTSIGLFFTQKGLTGNVNVAIAGVTASGTPDLNGVLNLTTLAVADIQTSGDGTVETKVPIPATFLEAGKRYSILLTTGGDHYIALAQAGAYAQGTFFFSLDGAYQQALVARDMMFSLYYAQFAKVRTVVDLEVLSLSGGIASIDILAPAIIPASCSLTFEVQVGGVWAPLAEVTGGNTILFGLPPLLPFRAVFVGTTDMQPGINKAESVLSYSRPRTAFEHISKAYTLAAPTQDFKVVAVLENYYEANHNLSCAIRVNGGTTGINPGSVVDEELSPPLDATDANHKRIKRTFTWTPTQITNPMTSVVIVMDGATTSALDVFHVAERVHLAF